ncbi:hypothetical protein Tco_0738092 [Tanacetum coccineum]
MPPRRFKKKSVRKIVEKRVAKAIETSLFKGTAGVERTESLVSKKMEQVFEILQMTLGLANANPIPGAMWKLDRPLILQLATEIQGWNHIN